uniref:Integrase catalytic domain-containing protein n=1 Tax=Haemonchus contortus TaxID=6289 RepID=A0A7I4XW91_HAECO
MSLIGTQKRLLTTFTNKLEHIISKLREETPAEVLGGSAASQNDLMETLRRLEEGNKILAETSAKVEEKLNSYASTVDALGEPSSKEIEDYQEYAERAEASISQAFDLQTLLQARLHSMKNQMMSADTGSPNCTVTQLKPKQLELPPLPIPTFGGDLWEWENFWELFNNNIHSQDLPEMVKYNYLLSALKGPAKEAIKRFQVTKGNYEKAIQFILYKYNNKELLINELIEQLGRCSLRSPSIKDQRCLLDEIQVIVTQLQEKGENVNSSWIIKKILGQFPSNIMRKAITRRQRMDPEESFTINHLIHLLDDLLSTEELWLAYTGDLPNKKPSNDNIKRNHSSPRSCMYCHDEHPSFTCTAYPTPQARSSYLRQKQLCLLCASPTHKTSECKRRPCFNCKGLHHTSCCYKQNSSKPREQIPKKADNPAVPTRSSDKTSKSSKSSGENISKNNAMMQMTTTIQAKELFRPSLPVGEITVIHPGTRKLMQLDVPLDSGAELSFINKSLAEELSLPVIKEELMRINTFGSEETRQRSYKLVELEAWDKEGCLHSLCLYTNDVITSPLTSPRIPESDIETIRNLNIPIQNLNINKRNSKPAILLGCDQMWSFIRTDTTPISLPSGLTLLPTKLGYIVSGRVQTTPNQNHQHISLTSADQDESMKWNNYWSMNIHVNTITPYDITISEKEQEMWEKYWTLDAAGTEEFTGSQEQIRDATDRAVWDKFNNSIEQRNDGYYVRLPWRENHPPLPDNYALAYRRLVNVLTSLKKDSSLLEQYHNVFQEQLQKGIVEPVNNNTAPTGKTIHYLPHQPVFTPQKTTTKLRIVFDASAHYKECSSLNDVLHRGPVLLPVLYGLLLRFRIGKIALISDVEKAFLQIRLHEADRDATRCLWLKDFRKPPDKGNIQTLRFTRVTFGLKSSPFLLAGTTQYHLNKFVEDALAQEIKDNIYVDNLILTSDTLQESIELYRKAKQIFIDLGMNLREFTSNNNTVMQTIQETDKADTPQPKVLGLKWNPQAYTLLATCSIPEVSTVTKRAITSAIASVYDPLGWLVPLLHKARTFLQFLWKEKHDWDSTIAANKAAEWTQILGNIQGFSKEIPRFLACRKSTVTLVTFADASTTGIAACVYLYHPIANSSGLLMAKSKLPSLQGQTTIPKLELNALTLAMRLSNSIITQLQKVLNIQGIYVFSDSEIVLSWIKKGPQREMEVSIHNRLEEIRRIANHIIGKNALSSTDMLHPRTTLPIVEQEKDETEWPAKNTIFEAPQDTKGEEISIPLRNHDYPILSTTHDTSSHDDFELIQRGHVRTLTKAKRIVAYAMRFIRVIASRANKKNNNSNIPLSLFNSEIIENSGPLTGQEIEFAGKMIIMHHQKTRITNSLKQKLQYLNIRPDVEGILRCYGRLGKAQLPIGAKYPIFVLQKTLLAEIIIQDIHNKYHPGTNHTMSLVRQQYWIPQLRSQVYRLIRKCLQCQKLNNLPYQYPAQEDLPKERVVKSSPFAHIGLDYFGPLPIKQPNGDKGKCYGSIITCMVTRLLLLDIVTDSSTVAFLQMLRRFFARRGVPRTIISDNAPTFLLGEAILRENFSTTPTDRTIAEALSNREIRWKHITPFAPWQGGFYERLVKSVKHSLYKTLRGSIVTIEELSTIVIEIESMLNTRPLTYIGKDMDTTQILRPIDFLQKDVEIIFPPLRRGEERSDEFYFPPGEIPSIQTRNQAIAALETSCQLTEKFWQIWQAEYLTSLREKHDSALDHKKGCSKEPREGQLVLICEAILPRHSWKTGIVEKLVMNNQGIVREAVIRLANRRLIRRPINLLVPLELEDEYPEQALSVNESKTQPRYNLRHHRQVDYNDDNNNTQNQLSSSIVHYFTTLQIVVCMALLCTSEVMGLENHTILHRDIRPSATIGCRILQYDPNPLKWGINVVYPNPCTGFLEIDYPRTKSEIIHSIFQPMTKNINIKAILSIPMTYNIYVQYSFHPRYMHHFRPSFIIMAEESAYKADFEFTASLYMEKISADDLEIDMTTSLHEIKQHLKMARTLDSQLTHHLLSTTEK